MNRMQLEKDYSFGIIPILKMENEYRFLIIQAIGGNWGFPKGHKENNEMDLETAKRELFEETGIKDIEIIDNLMYSENYNTLNKIGTPVDKTVLFFVAYSKSQTVKIQEEEVFDYKWATYEEAMGLFKYDNPKRILTKLVDDLKNMAI